MHGIDIVDLKDPLLKIRSTNDLRFISHLSDTHPSPDLSSHLIFLQYWAAKESVFKAKRKVEKFSPKSIPIIIKEFSSGTLSFSSHDFIGRIYMNDDYILSVAHHQSSPSPSFHTFKDISQNPSAAIRQKVLKIVSEKYQSNGQIIADINNLPALLWNKEMYPLSFSHHHQLMAFSIFW